MMLCFTKNNKNDTIVPIPQIVVHRKKERTVLEGGENEVYVQCDVGHAFQAAPGTELESSASAWAEHNEHALVIPADHCTACRLKRGLAMTSPIGSQIIRRRDLDVVEIELEGVLRDGQPVVVR